MLSASVNQLPPQLQKFSGLYRLFAYVPAIHGREFFCKFVSVNSVGDVEVQMRNELVVSCWLLVVG